jgi:hypothetical protein
VKHLMSLALLANIKLGLEALSGRQAYFLEESIMKLRLFLVKFPA